MNKLSYEQNQRGAWRGRWIWKAIMDQHFGKSTLELSILREHMLTSRCLALSHPLRPHGTSSYNCRRKAHSQVIY